MKQTLIFGLCLFLAAAALAPAAMTKDKLRLNLATTTSTMDSGLLDYLVPMFEKEQACQVLIIAVGTGAAIRLGRDGNADLVLVHDPAAEEAAVNDGFFVDRRYLMYNDFVVIGPAEDPAGTKGAASAAEALKAIQAVQATFVSRADQSGTHKKEQALWALAGIAPKGAWYLESGTGMANVLRIANEKKGYCLTDRGTYLAHKKELELAILSEGDQALFNPYHVMLVAPAKFPFVSYGLAKKFEEFLLSDRVQKMIGEFGVEQYGQPLFHPTAKGGAK